MQYSGMLHTLLLFNAENIALVQPAGIWLCVLSLQYSSMLYTLVLFNAADIAPEPAVSCFPPTTSTHEFLKNLSSHA